MVYIQNPIRFSQKGTTKGALRTYKTFRVRFWAPTSDLKVQATKNPGHPEENSDAENSKALEPACMEEGLGFRV